MVFFMPTRAMKNQWMDNVKIVFWGPAEKTIVGLAPDSDQIKMLKEIQAMGGKHGTGSGLAKPAPIDMGSPIRC